MYKKLLGAYFKSTALEPSLAFMKLSSIFHRVVMYSNNTGYTNDLAYLLE